MMTSQSTLAVKGYIIEEGFHREEWHTSQQPRCGNARATHYYDITYKDASYTERFIRFSKIEYQLQFVDLLHEAGYRYDEEYKSLEQVKETQTPIPPPHVIVGKTVRP